MKKQLFFFLSYLTALTFTACGGSDDDAPSTPPVVETATQTILTVQQSGSGISGNTNKNQTGNEKLDTRYEVPRIIGGNDYYSIICEVPTYGVNYIIEWNVHSDGRPISCIMATAVRTGTVTTGIRQNGAAIPSSQIPTCRQNTALNYQTIAALATLVAT